MVAAPGGLGELRKDEIRLEVLDADNVEEYSKSGAF